MLSRRGPTASVVTARSALAPGHHVRAAELDEAEHGIRVNTLAPGMFPHEEIPAHMTANRTEGYVEAGKTIPASRGTIFGAAACAISSTSASILTA